MTQLTTFQELKALASIYELRVTETSNKAGRYLYEVINPDGSVHTTRRSNRVYVACTRSGSHFFGRLDLVFKGDHGRQIKHVEKNPYGRPQDETDKALEELNSIAYIKNVL